MLSHPRRQPAVLDERRLAESYSASYVCKIYVRGTATPSAIDLEVVGFCRDVLATATVFLEHPVQRLSPFSDSKVLAGRSPMLRRDIFVL